MDQNQIKNQPIKDQLLAKGWIMFYECKSPCWKQNFNHPDHPGIVIVARSRTNTFSILQNNHIIAGAFWGYQIEEKLPLHIK